MCIQVQQITYIHPDKEVLFRNLSFTVGKGRQLALIGNNGCGKSTLLQIMAGKLQPSSGNVLRPDDLYYVPQHFGQYDEMSIAQALGIDRKQKALHEILNGNASIDHFNILDDDWNIEEKALAALNGWGLGNRSLSESMHTLSGGEKTRVFLAGLELQTPSASPANTTISGCCALLSATYFCTKSFPITSPICKSLIMTIVRLSRSPAALGNVIYTFLTIGFITVWYA